MAEQNIFEVVAFLVTFVALTSWVNEHFWHLSRSIALMLSSLLISLALFAITQVGVVDAVSPIRAMVESIDFQNMLMRIVLAFLLFAGALFVNLEEFLKEKTAIGILATIGVASSALVIGFGVYIILPFLGIMVPLGFCLLLGALISPTDPIATLSLLEDSPRVPESIKMKIAGEALLNDGVGIVLYFALVGYATGGTLSGVEITTLFLREAVGGLGLGLAVGFIAYRLLKGIDNHQVEIFITLSVVMQGFALAEWLEVSGALTMVSAGLFIGNRGRKLAMSKETNERLSNFWENVDAILNASLFTLVGFEVLLLDLRPIYIVAGILVIPVVLFARLASVSLSAQVSSVAQRRFDKYATHILTWGGLRGGISFALALGLPPSPYRDVMIVITYMVVSFSIVVQGLTLGKLLKSIGL